MKQKLTIMLFALVLSATAVAQETDIQQTKIAYEEDCNDAHGIADYQPESCSQSN